MADLAKLVVRLEAQSAQLTKELQAATRKVDSFEKNVSSAVGRVRSAFTGFAAGLAGAFSVGAITSFAKATIDMADEVNRASQVVGLSTEAFSGLQYAAKQAGVDSAAFQSGLTKLSKTAIDAADGTGQAADAFEALGVSVKGADGNLKAVDQLLIDTADAFSKAAGGIEETAAAQAIFGKSGADLLPLLNEGRSGIEALREEAQRLGLVISGDAAKAADQFNDTMDRLKGAVVGAGQQAVQKLMPSLNAIATLAADAASESSALTAVMDGLSIAFKGVVSAGIVVGNVFEILGKTVAGIAAAVVQAVQGDFQGALNALGESGDDIIQDFRDIGNGVSAVWNGTADNVEAASDRMRKGNGKLGFGQVGNEANNAKKKIDEYAASLESAAAIAAEADKLFAPLKADAARVIEDTLSPLDKFNARLERLNQLRNTIVDGAPLINAQQYSRAVAQAQDQLDQVVEGIEKVGKTTADTTDEMSNYAEQAAKNIQDIFADFLFKPFKGGLDGMLSNFADTLHRMATQAASEQILGGLMSFGSGGFLDTILGMGGGLGGSAPIDPPPGRASGGPVMAGNMYMVGEEGPELFISDRKGSIVPNDELGRPISVTNHFTIQAPQGTVSRQTQDQIAYGVGRAVTRATQRNG